MFCVVCSVYFVKLCNENERKKNTSVPPMIFILIQFSLVVFSFNFIFDSAYVIIAIAAV